MRRVIPAIMLLLCAQFAWAAARPAELTICYEDSENYPWLLRNGKGYDMIMIDMVQRSLGIAIHMVSKPWKRCLLEMQANAVDGIVNASYVPERLAMGAYPTRDGKPDAARRMAANSYSLYRIRDSLVHWDGAKISGLGNPVCIQTSFSIGSQLRQQGIAINEVGKTAVDLFRGLLMGKCDAAALQTENGDQMLAANPEFNSRIEKLPLPLVEKPFYLMLSKGVVANYPDTAKEIWDTIAKVRESAEFQRQVRPLFKGD